MQPSWHAIELLRAITHGQTIELQQRLARAAGDCRSAMGLAPYGQESFELLRTCVEALQSHSVSSPRGRAAVQILLHLAEAAEAENLMLSLAPGNYRSTTSASSHR